MEPKNVDAAVGAKHFRSDAKRSRSDDAEVTAVHTMHARSTVDKLLAHLTRDFTQTSVEMRKDMFGTMEVVAKLVVAVKKEVKAQATRVDALEERIRVLEAGHAELTNLANRLLQAVEAQEMEDKEETWRGGGFLF